MFGYCGLCFAHDVHKLSSAEWSIDERIEDLPTLRLRDSLEDIHATACHIRHMPVKATAVGSQDHLPLVFPDSVGTRRYRGAVATSELECVRRLLTRKRNLERADEHQGAVLLGFDAADSPANMGG